VSAPKHSISKSSFLKYEQCPKAFFLYRHFPYLRDKISTDKQLTFKRGHEIGHLAHALFPGGTDISKITSSSAEGVEETSRRLAQGERYLYEACFLFEETLVIVDLLIRTETGFQAFEVKSSLRVSDTYIKDACLQYYVVKNCLPQLEDFFLVTLNPDYRLKGELEVKKLFRKRSIRQQAEEHIPYFEHQLAKVRLLLNPEAMPQCGTGTHCFKPYPCDFLGHCWQNEKSADSIFEFPMVNKNQVWDWYQQGIKKISDLREEHLERAVLQKVREALQTNAPVIDRGAIRSLLNGIQQPYLVMDMEVFSPAVPCLQDTGPFFQIPFLASFSSGNVSHSIFVEKISPSDLRHFALAVIAYTATSASIVVYDKNLEGLILQSLAQRFPDLKNELDQLKAKLVDISEVFKKLHYYHPDFRGSFSLKTLISVLVPEFNYEGIASGLAAMDEYAGFLKEENLIHREITRARLQQYCEGDARATHLLHIFLEELK